MRVIVSQSVYVFECRSALRECAFLPHRNFKLSRESVVDQASVPVARSQELRLVLAAEREDTQ